MKTGRCPKCGSENLKKFKPKGIVGDASSWDYEYVGAIKIACSSRYVCCDCGYSERYFEGKDLEKIKNCKNRG